MARRVSYRVQVVIEFLASVIAGYWLSRREDGGERVKENVLSSLAGAVGMVIGYGLGRRETGSRDVS